MWKGDEESAAETALQTTLLQTNCKLQNFLLSVFQIMN